MQRQERSKSKSHQTEHAKGNQSVYLRKQIRTVGELNVKQNRRLGMSN